jgi:putative acetyltransferase
MPDATTDRDIEIGDADDMTLVRALFREYQAFLGVDLCFQDFEAELAQLPGKYTPPRGRILFAHCGGALAGCVAMRPIDTITCEMKRMFVRPAYRGRGLGRRLADAIVTAAREGGYRAMRLDTLDTLGAAIALYRKMGFAPIDAYYDNPLPGVIYLEKSLDGASRT